MHLHGIEEICETGIIRVAHSIQRIGNALTDMLDGRLGIGDCVVRAINVEVTVVLPEAAGGNADTKALAHFILGLSNPCLLYTSCHRQMLCHCSKKLAVLLNPC